IREVKPGVFFPTLTEGRKVRDGRPASDAKRARITDLQINDPIDEKLFDFQFPLGVWVTDRTTMSIYRVGPDGQRVTETPLPPPPKEVEIRYPTGAPRDHPRWGAGPGPSHLECISSADCSVGGLTSSRGHAKDGSVNGSRTRRYGMPRHSTLELFTPFFETLT